LFDIAKNHRLKDNNKELLTRRRWSASFVPTFKACRNREKSGHRECYVLKQQYNKFCEALLSDKDFVALF